MADEKNTALGAGLGGAVGAGLASLLAERPAKAAPADEKLDYLADLAETQVQQLQKLVDIAEQLAGQVPITLEPKIVPGLVQIPLDPEVLNRALQATRLPGKAWFPTIRLSWVCPAGTVTEFPVGMPAGYICTRRVMSLASDFYDPNISVEVHVDDGLVTPYGIALTGVSTIDFGEYFVKHREILVTTDNGTGTDAQLSLEVVPSFLEKSFYDEFYAPIIDYMYSALEGVARGEV